MSKLLFKSNIGTLFDDKVVIANKEFPYNRILSIDMEEQINNKINFLFLLGSTFFYLLAEIIIMDNIFFYLSLLCCFVFIIISIFYKNKEYFLLFYFSTEEQLELKVKSKNKQEAKEFLMVALDAKLQSKD